MVDQPESTDLHGFEYPPQGYDSADPTWQELDNEIFREIDARLELRGSVADRPAAADVPAGSKYTVTSGDEKGAVFVEDAGAWDKQPVNTPAVNADEENNSVYWVKGDRATDIMNTIDDAPAGATVKLEARDYPLHYLDDGPIQINKPITLEGSGWGSRIYLEDNSTDTDVGSENIEVRAKNVTLRNFQLDGNWENNNPGESGTVEDGHNIDCNYPKFSMYNVWSHSSTGDGVELIDGADDAIIRNCWFYNNWEHGIGLNGCTDPLIHGCIVDKEVNNSLIGTWNGDGNAATEGVKIINCIVRNPQTRGIRITSGKGKVKDVTIRDLDFYGATGKRALQILDGSSGNPPEHIDISKVRVFGGWRGLYIRGARDVTAEGLYIENTKREAIKTEDCEYDVTISDVDIVDANQGTNNNDDAIRLHSAVAGERIRVDDVDFRQDSTRDVRNVVKGSGSGSLDGGSEVVDIRVDDTSSYEQKVVSFGNLTYDGDVRRIGPGRREESGINTQSGDGSSTTFAIPHTLGRKPDMVNVVPASADANGNFYVDTINFSQVKITYASAPASGTDNLTWRFHFRVDDV